MLEKMGIQIVPFCCFHVLQQNKIDGFKCCFVGVWAFVCFFCCFVFLIEITQGLENNSASASFMPWEIFLYFKNFALNFVTSLLNQ